VGCANHRPALQQHALWRSSPCPTRCNPCCHVMSRPRYFAEIMANLLFWLGPDKILFGSDYAIWTPKWQIEKLMAFELPDDIRQEYGVELTLEIKQKILGENAARLYGIDPAAHRDKLSRDAIGVHLAAATADQAGAEAFPAASVQEHA
jgi:hypothetical protein